MPTVFHHPEHILLAYLFAGGQRDKVMVMGRVKDRDMDMDMVMATRGQGLLLFSHLHLQNL